MEIFDAKIEILDEPKDGTYPFIIPEEGEVYETTGNKVIRIQFKLKP